MRSSDQLKIQHSKFNIALCASRFALYICVMAPPAAPDTISSITRSTYSATRFQTVFILVVFRYINKMSFIIHYAVNGYASNLSLPPSEPVPSGLSVEPLFSVLPSEPPEGPEGLDGLAGEEAEEVGFSLPLGVRYTSLTPP